MSNDMKESLVFFLDAAKPFYDVLRVLHWFTFKIDRRFVFILFNIDLLIFLGLLFAENLFDQALSWASNLADISYEDISITKHARKSLLFNHGKPWIKNNAICLMLPWPMGSNDGAEIC